MSGEVGALGELVNAGLAARALDRPDPATAGHDSHGACANCGATLHGHFCHDCGQKAHLHRSLIDVAEEFLHGITHFDSKTWRTLPMLVTRPGQLTWNYIHGHRARYIAPVPLFLLVVFTMFFVLSFVHLPGDAIQVDPVSQSEAAKRVKSAEESLADIDREIAQAKAAGNTTLVATLTASRATITGLRDRMAARARGELDTPMDIPGEVRREMTQAAEKGDFKINFGIPYLDKKAAKAIKNPDLVLYKLQSKAYKLSFLLVPLSLPWLWLVFCWKRGIHLYDHAVFALYSISFMSLLFILGSVALTLDVTNGTFWFCLIFVAPVVHMYAQLKGAYRLGWFGATWRTAFLGVSAIITLSVYAVLMIALGVLE